jgi:glutathione synthase/RimK-type ligase-like ATP-grasp enzyme
MRLVIVLEEPERWPLRLPGVEVVPARSYLTEPQPGGARVRVFNLCRSYGYQRTGYYVSLLAEARGHRPLPSVTTLQDLKSRTLVRLASDELDERIQRSLRGIRSPRFTLSIYFGDNPARMHAPLVHGLFDLFRAPLLRAEFARNRRWALASVKVIAADDVPEKHREFLVEAAGRYFAGRRPRVRRRTARFDLAILHDPDEANPPSDRRALARFVKAATALELQPTFITRADQARLGEFDALFIRETTCVNHHTYRFARRAAAEGMVVVDDPVSIARCTNKVFLAERLGRNRIPIPPTLIVNRENAHTIADSVGLPCVLKLPDGAFSKGVVKAETEEEAGREAARFLAASDLVLAQPFLPTPFDWRVGILDRKPLYVCKYHMAPRHWQIIRHDGRGKRREGRVETLAVEDAPPRVVRTALRAANLIGDGFYGVDLKQAGNRVYVIEVNDNPSIDAGYEDACLGDALYRRVMEVFLARLLARKGEAG